MKHEPETSKQTKTTRYNPRNNIYIWQHRIILQHNSLQILWAFSAFLAGKNTTICTCIQQACLAQQTVWDFWNVTLSDTKADQSDCVLNPMWAPFFFGLDRKTYNSSENAPLDYKKIYLKMNTGHWKLKSRSMHNTTNIRTKQNQQNIYNWIKLANEHP